MVDQRLGGFGAGTVEHENACLRGLGPQLYAFFQPGYEEGVAAGGNKCARDLGRAQPIAVRLDHTGHGRARQPAADAVILCNRAQPHRQARNIEI